MAFRTIRRDRGKARILRELKKLKLEPFVKVGYPAESLKANAEHGDGGITTLQVAIFHEFGTVTIPQRSFIRSTHQESKKEMSRFIAREVKSFYRGGRTPEQILDRIGIKAVSLIKRKIRSNIPPALKVRVGTALIDTGQLMNSLSHKKIRFGKGRRR